MRRSEFPRDAVVPHIDYVSYARRAPLRATGLFTAIGLASALGYALGLAAAVGLGTLVSATFARSQTPAAAPAPAAAHTSKFILNALLVPAIDSDSLPLRWVDPRPRLRCGPGTVVRVNGVPLKSGELVPDAPFEMEWWSDECHPFGVAGPRLDGGVKLTVFREDFGFSAMVEPRGLFEVADGTQTRIERGGASYPLCSGDNRDC